MGSGRGLSILHERIEAVGKYRTSFTPSHPRRKRNSLMMNQLFFPFTEQIKLLEN
jgi:hypothetical protein